MKRGTRDALCWASSTCYELSPSSGYLSPDNKVIETKTKNRKHMKHKQTPATSSDQLWLYLTHLFKTKKQNKKNIEAPEKDIYFWRGNSIHSNRMSNGQEFSDPDLNSLCKHCNPVFLQRKQILNWDFQQPDFCDQMAEAQNRAARDPGSSSRGTNPWIIWLLPLFPSIADCFYDCFFHLLIAFRRLSTCFCLVLMFYF